MDTLRLNAGNSVPDGGLEIRTPTHTTIHMPTDKSITERYERWSVTNWAVEGREGGGSGGEGGGVKGVYASLERRRERERERGREREGEREGERKREGERGREGERERGRGREGTLYKEFFPFKHLFLSFPLSLSLTHTHTFTHTNLSECVLASVHQNIQHFLHIPFTHAQHQRALTCR